MQKYDLQKIKSLLGLAQKAGKLKSGDFAAQQAILHGDAKLVLLTTDISTERQDKFEKLCSNSGVQTLYCGVMDEIGEVLGKSPRSVVAIVDNNFAQAMLKNLGFR